MAQRCRFLDPRSPVEALEPRRMLAGVTLITHGFGSDADGWVTEMADAVAWRQGVEPAQQPRYKLTATDPGHTGGAINIAVSQLGPPVASWGSADVVLLLDWSDVAGSLPFGGYTRPTGVVGDAVAATLVQPGVIPGHAGSLAGLPVHVIGHSRGAAVIAATARQLSAAGVWVDQVTTLDPHPVDGVNEPFGFPIDYGDGPVHAYENVIFHDNYWRTDGPFSTDVTGQPVAGAFDLQLSESVLSTGGYPSGEHSDVHLWYHGTVDTRVTAHNGDHPVPTGWYVGNMGPRTELGYAFTGIGGVTRPPAGVSPAFGGGGSRQPVPAAGAQWPNVSDLGLPAGDLIAGEPIVLSYLYQDRDSAATVRFWLDDDPAPFDGETPLVRGQATHAPVPLPESATAVISTDGLVHGSYFLFAQIEDAGGRSRMAMRPVTLEPAAPEVTSAAFEVDGPAQRLVLTFNADVGSTLSPEDLELTNETTGTPVTPGQFVLAYDPPTMTAQVSFAGYPSGILPDGNYRLVLPAGSVSSGGVPLAADFSYRYFFLNGDANRDRNVDLGDFAVLRAHFGSGGRVFTQADFTYDGLVNLADFAVLRSQFGLILPPPDGEGFFDGDGDEGPAET